VRGPEGRFVSKKEMEKAKGENETHEIY